MIEDTNALVELIDKFLDEPYCYTRELGRFIARASTSPHLEPVRHRLLENEALLDSGAPLDRLRYNDRLLAERNALASLVGKPARTN